MSSFFVVDCETGGLDPEVHSIFSIAFVAFHSEKNYFDYIKEEKFSFTTQALAINKLDLSTIDKIGKKPAVVVEEILEFLPKKVNLIGHNVNFDFGFLSRLFKMAGYATELRRFSHRKLCTCAVLNFLNFARGKPNASASSDALFKLTGVEEQFPNWVRHTAMGDAQLTKEALKILIQTTNCNLEFE